MAGARGRRLVVACASTMKPSRTAVPARVALVAVAIAAIAFLGVGLRAALPQAEGRELASADLDQKRYREALELFRDAQRMNPDTDADLLEGGLLLAGGSPRRAARVIERVTREEPLNSKAWALLAAAAREFDPALAREARGRLRLVKPPVGP